MIEGQTIVRIHGEQISEFPSDLFIPPDALRIFLEAFEGPLDFLLYLIKKQNFDILDIPIAEITRQYMHYIDLMITAQFELAADYLVMAAWLAEIKSRLLLPRQEVLLETEEDPRAELVRRLQEYERFQQAAQELDHLTRVERDTFVAGIQCPDLSLIPLSYPVEVSDLWDALVNLLQKAELSRTHRIAHEPLSVRERMTDLLSRLTSHRFYEFKELFPITEGRMGVVVTLLAILELVRQSAIELTQENAFSTIYVRSCCQPSPI